MESLIGTPNAGGAGQDANAADLIKEGDTASFAQDVLDESMSVPVLVDFWATWCGPCKQLGPALEKVVREARGAVRLVKIDVDRNQELAQQLRVQSVPMVYAFFQGQPVDGFVGAQSEREIKTFVERLVGRAGTGKGPSPVEQALEQAEAALEGGQPGPASALFGQILQQEPENAIAVAGLIRCHIVSEDIAGAQRLFDSLTDALRDDPALASVKASLELAAQADQAGEIPELMERLARDPGDHQTRFELALALNANNKREAAADELLEIVRRDRKWNDDGARAQLLKFFEAWGPKDPATLHARRRLSSLLFA